MITRRLVVRCLFGLALGAMLPGPSSVFATQEKTDRLYVLGHVRSAGAYPHKPDMTVGDAIDAAGGILPHGGKAIEIIRIVNGEKQVSNATFNDAVLPDDSVVVK
jgi:protein involved in polysaccharide export with SLBB domain